MTPNAGSFAIPRADAGSLTGSALPTSGGVGLAGPGTIGDQFATLIAHWDEARFLSKPAAVRHMMLLRQRGQGGTFETEQQAFNARVEVAKNLNPGDFDWEIDVYNAGFNAYITLTIRAQGPHGLGTATPNLAMPPAPAVDLNSVTTPQPFSEWIAVLSPAGDNGVDSQWLPNPDDKGEVGSTWGPGIAKRTTSLGTYTKKRYIQNSVYYDRWVRTA